jgi:HAD superfamily hydrolase (TIGR01509 family)
MNNGYEAIFFDFDGVLVDSEPVHHQCWCEILKPYGFALDWATYARDCIGVADREMLRRFAEQAGPPVEFQALLGEYPRKKALFRRKMETADVFHPATLDLVRSLRGYKLAVVSSSARTEVEPPLVRAGLRDRFDVLVCGWEAARLKPAPDPYLTAAGLLGVSRALVVEDSDTGEQSGRAAGFDVLRVSSPAEVAGRVRGILRPAP